MVVASVWLVRLFPAVKRRGAIGVDLLVAFVLAAAGLISVGAGPGAGPRPPAGLPWTLAEGLAVLAVTAPLVFRRVFPLCALTAVVAAYVVTYAMDVSQLAVTTLAGAMAIYSAAAFGPRRWRMLVLGLALAVVLGLMLRHLLVVQPQGWEPVGVAVVLAFNAVVLGLPWALGAGVRSLRHSVAEQARQAEELRREREELRREREARARQAVLEERVRIARELHDVVAHHVSLMGVQAGAARMVMAEQPEVVPAALLSIEESSRQAVRELQSLLGFLRQGEDVDDLTGQPDLTQLPDLVHAVATTGLRVELVVHGEPALPIPRLLRVSAYRIVQEALTNAVKHAGASHATVHVRHRPQTLEVQVLDDGSAATGRPVGTHGHGLVGMNERAKLHGGRLSTGPRAGGGFAVTAHFPLPSGDLR